MRYWKLIFVFLLTGCAGILRDCSSTVDGYAKICIDGYSWIYVTHAAIEQQIGGDGKPVACSK